MYYKFGIGCLIGLLAWLIFILKSVQVINLKQQLGLRLIIIILLQNVTEISWSILSKASSMGCICFSIYSSVLYIFLSFVFISDVRTRVYS